jgi:hypothetical protein
VKGVSVIRGANVRSSLPFFVNSAWFRRKFTRQPTVSPAPNVSA